MNSLLKYIYFGFLIFILYSCAQPGYLTGGEKDISAPSISVEDTINKRKREFPPNQSIQFSTDRIEIHFDELIALKDEKKQIIITPTMETPPIFEVKGKRLFIYFETTPNPNTTYIINFGDAIVDITEGNIFSNYKYVFSTGSYIDSLKYKAFVRDAITKTPVADTWVMLYQELEDSIPLLQKPYYFAKTNSSGNCSIENIAAGTYKSFVLQDQNSNYRFDQAIEKIGFSNQLLELRDSITIDTFSLFTNYTSKGKLGDIKIAKNGKLSIVLPQPTTEAFQPNTDLLSHFWNNSLTLNDTKDTISGWIKPKKKETNGVKFSLKDYQSTTFTTSQPTDSIVNFITNGSRTIKTNENFFIEFSQPIERVNMDKIKFLVNDQPSKINYSVNETKVIFENELNPDSSYILNAFPGAFSTIYGNSNDSLSVFLNVGKPSDFGNIFLNIEQPNSEDLIIELLDNETIIQRKKLGEIHSTNLTFENLEPKSYNIRIIFDANQNGIWDTGNYFMQIQPEKIAYYSDPIEVRKGWDLDLTWIIK